MSTAVVATLAPLALNLLASAFLGARLVVWAILVCLAWLEVIENDREQEETREALREADEAGGARPIEAPRLDDIPQAPPRLTVNAVHRHDRVTGPARPGIGRMTQMAPPSESDDSIDDWSIWEGQESHPGTPRIQRPSLDHPAKEVTVHHNGAGDHHKKKPLLTRKIEKWFVKPWAAKDTPLGYFVYKGINKTGRRLEKASFLLATNLDLAIRDAGVEAIDRLEFIARKWVKFVGIVAILTIVLLPLPNVRISLAF